MRKIHLKSFALTFIIILVIFSAPKAEKIVKCGYFEGGSNPVHSLLRDEFTRQLKFILDDSINFVYTPTGYNTADWNRKKSKQLAENIVLNTELDMVIAFGPWVVNDLLEAGFDKPIIAFYQFDPKLTSLIDDNNRPIADNLTLLWDPEKVVRDISLISKLTDKKNLGWLYFPNADEGDTVFEFVKRVAADYDLKVVTDTGSDDKGTYTYFKSYAKLSNRVDMVYMAPLWGMDNNKIGALFRSLHREKKPGFIYDGSLILEKGAFATSNYYRIVSEARLLAENTKLIIENEVTPADLPVIYNSGTILAVNEDAAKNSGIELPERLLNSYLTIPAKTTDDIEYYSLSDALFRAVSQNPGYLARESALKAAAFNSEAQKRKFYPQLSANGSYRYSDDNFTHNYYEYFDNSQLEATLVLDQKLFSKTTKKSIELSQAEEEIKKEELNSFKSTLERDLTLAYLEYLKLREIKAAFVNKRKMIDFNIELMSAIMSRNDDNTSDIFRLEAKRAKINSQVVEIRKDIENVRVLINSLLNFPPSSELTFDTVTFSQKMFLAREVNIINKIDLKSKQDLLAANLLQTTLADSPDIKIKDKIIELRKKYSESYKATYYPEFSLQASLNFHDRLKEDIYFSEKKSSWSLGGKIELPLFLGGQRGKTAQKLTELTYKSEYEKDETALEIMNRLNAQLNNFISRALSFTSVYNNYDYSSKALDNVNEKYNKGSVTVGEFFNAFDVSLKADVDIISVRYNYYQEMTKLFYLTGNSGTDNYSDFLNEFHKLISY